MQSPNPPPDPVAARCTRDEGAREKRRVIAIQLDPTGPQLVVNVIRNDGGARYVSPTASSRVRLLRLMDRPGARVIVREARHG